MNLIFPTWLAAFLLVALMFPLSTTASEQRTAEQLCRSKIEDVYGVSNFRNVWSEREGNHKFRVHGQVKRDHHKYDFNCKVKHGNVKTMSPTAAPVPARRSASRCSRTNATTCCSTASATSTITRRG